MELHVKGQADDISRYVFCPGSQSRAARIASSFEEAITVSEERGIVVYSGYYNGVFMTSCGTGMGGPATAIACEELAHMGADTFIRVGSCGVLQQGQGPGDIIIANGTFRAGGTGDYYLPPRYPAVPTFEVTRQLVAAAEKLQVPVRVGVGIAGDSFYTLKESSHFRAVKDANGLFIEMESDALFIVGHARGWRTGALFTSDGEPGEVKPDWANEAYAAGEENMRLVALEAMFAIAQMDSGN
jgi:uridine phosphorylase